MKKLVLITIFLGTNLLANSISKEDLGKILFFDINLSQNRTQSCATCHNPQVGFIDDRDNGISKMASLGDDLKSLGDRQAPTASYAKFSPKFHYDEKKKLYKGGQFWDGRANTLEEQAGGPPLNPIEMGLKDESQVVARLKENSFYIESFKALFGKDIFDNDKKAFEALSQVIASFEKTDEFSTFDSKYDRYLKGEYDLTPLEDLGMSIFFSNNNNSCATCHVLKGEDKEGETFTNYEFHNIGVPINNQLRAKNGIKEKDLGLAANPNIKNKDENLGKYKTPTLRNVAVTSPYMHNGVFKDLKTVVLFYDKYNNKENNINPETNEPWDEPEFKDTISLKELKANAQSDRKIDALVAFMKLLTDKRYEHLIKD
ncbi:methylamine utilization protein MauG [Aliarcobacter trophiarum LMG 25534]|uniref:Diheme cytochrome c peroxidase n=1 Tax=Aliarcobacter trophiarum LMG 25534 TaxID=1032241 RepID=A0AAD0QKA8_9BACT|nr:cytochrome c peroxidase [Aliarcobacter trophiarum]AXK48485.1 diheme cytochrome c peroxidase [Aliarcobacter trophiarum LMG 25534]RXJ89983.1 methylamine utilization protein MauG [Aliarcobacter trophiarum LMG 25534]